MKITIDILKKNKARTELLDYFTTTFSWDAEVDVYEFIAQIHKDKKNFSHWLYRKFKLSGICERFYGNGGINYRQNCKDGKFHGFGEYFYKNRGVRHRGNYKDGVLIDKFLN